MKNIKTKIISSLKETPKERLIIIWVVNLLITLLVMYLGALDSMKLITLPTVLAWIFRIMTPFLIITLMVFQYSLAEFHDVRSAMEPLIPSPKKMMQLAQKNMRKICKSDNE